MVIISGATKGNVAASARYFLKKAEDLLLGNMKQYEDISGPVRYFPATCFRKGSIDTYSANQTKILKRHPKEEFIFVK